MHLEINLYDLKQWWRTVQITCQQMLDGRFPGPECGRDDMVLDLTTHLTVYYMLWEQGPPVIAEIGLYV